MDRAGTGSRSGAGTATNGCTVSAVPTANYRQAVAAVAYLLCDQQDLHHAFAGWKLRLFTGRVFGPAPVDRALAQIQGYLDGLGQATVLGRPNLQGALYELMLLAGSPLLEDLAKHGELLARMRARETNNARRHGVEQLTRTLVEMGVMARMPFATQPSREEWLDRSQAGEIDVPPEWLAWTRRWFETSTLAPEQPAAHLLRADQGRSLAAR